MALNTSMVYLKRYSVVDTAEEIAHHFGRLFRREPEGSKLNRIGR